MDLVVFIVGYLSVTAFMLFILLFGESPMFIGTPVPRVHWFFTQGVCEGIE